MSQRKEIESFNHHLNALLHGDESDLTALPETDLEALKIAHRLAALDLSAQSKQRFILRRKLVQKANLPSKAWPGVTWRLPLQPSAATVIALPSATLLFVLVFVLGWTFTNLGRPPTSNDLVSATAFAVPGTSIESGLPPLEQHPAAQVFAPQPLPTPIAPLQPTTQLPTTVGPDQTPQLTSWRTNRIGVTQVDP